MAERAAGAFGSLYYLALSIQQPAQWTVPVWVLLAFLLGPALIGLIAGRLQRGEMSPLRRFRGGLQAGVITMFLYTSITLMALHARMGSSGDGGQVFLVGLFVSVIYALIAGVVAGAVSSRLGRAQRARERP